MEVDPIHLCSPQQQSQAQIIQRALGVVELEGTEIYVVLIEIEEEIIIAKAVDEVPLDQGLDVQAQIEVWSGVEEVVQLCGMKTK